MKPLKAAVGIATFGIVPAYVKHKEKKGLKKIAEQKGIQDLINEKKKADSEKKALEKKTEVEKKRARKLSLRGLRTKRTASYYTQYEQADQGSKTVG